MRAALARLKPSSMTSSSIRFSLTGGQVGWTMKMSRPRTSSSMRTEISPSGKLFEGDLAEGVAQAGGDLLGQGEVGPAAEDLELVVVRSVACHRRAPERPSPGRRTPGPPALPLRGGELWHYEKRALKRQPRAPAVRVTAESVQTVRMGASGTRFGASAALRGGVAGQEGADDLLGQVDRAGLRPKADDRADAAEEEPGGEVGVGEAHHPGGRRRPGRCRGPGRTWPCGFRTTGTRPRAAASPRRA